MLRRSLSTITRSSLPPRSLPLPRKTLSRGPSDFYHRLLETQKQRQVDLVSAHSLAFQHEKGNFGEERASAFLQAQTVEIPRPIEPRGDVDSSESLRRAATEHVLDSGTHMGSVWPQVLQRIGLSYPGALRKGLAAGAAVESTTPTTASRIAASWNSRTAARR